MAVTTLPPPTSDSTTSPAAGPRSGTGSDFAVLRRLVTDAGLLRRRPGYYLLRTGVVAAAYVGTWVGILWLGASWWQLGLAAVLAVVFTQVALLAHDLAHRQVFRSRRRSAAAGRIAGNLGIGMSYGWWMDKHTRHHANPNHEELDPDVSPDVLVWSTAQAGRKQGRVRRLLTRWQGYLFVPLLTLEGFNLHASSVRALARPGVGKRGPEAALLALHVAGYLALVLLSMPVGMAAAFVLVNQAVFGLYLGGTFAPNHKGMPTRTGNDRPDFLRKQVLTSRNVTGGWPVDVALGGLNYQIEHHLFPSMPTPNLRRARPVVRAYCDRIGLEYCETRLARSYVTALRHLNRVGGAAGTGQ